MRLSFRYAVVSWKILSLFVYFPLEKVGLDLSVSHTSHIQADCLNNGANWSSWISSDVILTPIKCLSIQTLWLSFAGPVAGNPQRSCCWDIDQSEGVDCFKGSRHTFQQLFSFWQRTPFHILPYVLMTPFSFFFFFFLKIFQVIPLFTSLTSLHFRSFLWVGPALLFSSATAVSMLGWDSKVRTILSISMPCSGVCFSDFPSYLWQIFF